MYILEGNGISLLPQPTLKVAHDPSDVVASSHECPPCWEGSAPHRSARHPGQVSHVMRLGLFLN
jgi:hypothetical protein